MKSIIVVGLGSMGQRRIRLLKRMYPEILIGGVDVLEQRRQNVQEKFGIETFASLAEAVEHLDPFAGFVCTSPLSHYGIIMQLLSVPIHVFTELNLLADGYPEMMALANKQGVVLFLSSTLLYRNDIQYLIERSAEGPVNYWIHSGQYLPDWHPWEGYQDYFVGDQRTNGCREIFAVDLPWILAAFGEVESVSVMRDQSSSLDINYPDNYIVSMRHQSGSKGVFYCDVISRNGGRRAEIFSENMFLSWEGFPDSLYIYDIGQRTMCPVQTYHNNTEHLHTYRNPSIIEDAYREEMTTFFKTIEGHGKALYTMEDDIRTLALIDRIEGKL